MRSGGHLLGLTVEAEVLHSSAGLLGVGCRVWGSQHMGASVWPVG